VKIAIACMQFVSDKGCSVTHAAGISLLFRGLPWLVGVKLGEAIAVKKGCSDGKRSERVIGNSSRVRGRQYLADVSATVM